MAEGFTVAFCIPTLLLLLITSDEEEEAAAVDRRWLSKKPAEGRHGKVAASPAKEGERPAGWRGKTVAEEGKFYGRSIL